MGGNPRRAYDHVRSEVTDYITGHFWLKPLVFLQCGGLRSGLERKEGRAASGPKEAFRRWPRRKPATTASLSTSPTAK